MDFLQFIWTGSFSAAADDNGSQHTNKLIRVYSVKNNADPGMRGWLHIGGIESLLISRIGLPGVCANYLV